MRPCISIRGFVRPSIHPFFRRSVRRSVTPLPKTHVLHLCGLDEISDCIRLLIIKFGETLSIVKICPRISISVGPSVRPSFFYASSNITQRTHRVARLGLFKIWEISTNALNPNCSHRDPLSSLTFPTMIWTCIAPAEIWYHPSGFWTFLGTASNTIQE